MSQKFEEDCSNVWPQNFSPMRKCGQNLISFSFASNMIDVTNDTRNYDDGQRIFVSVREYERPKQERNERGA